MDAKIDYLSWTVTTDLSASGQGRLLRDTAVSEVWREAPHFAAWAETVTRLAG